MKTPKTLQSMKLVGTCQEISAREWHKFMDGTTKADGKQIRKLIAEHLPKLYKSLVLNFPNPYEHQSRKKDGLLVYMHSGIEYFIEYTNYGY